MKILIADDETVSRLVLGAMLERINREYVLSTNGHEAWDAYLAERPSIIITDWMMPEIDGLELTRMIRADRRRPYPYIIIMTTLGGKGSYLEGMNAGADDYITKPFDFDMLNARLLVAQRILSLHGENEDLRGNVEICPSCRKVKDERNPWMSPEAYIAMKARSSFLTSVCPDCEKKGNVSDDQHLPIHPGN